MVDALHLVIFNLILSKNQKFHDLESSILPFLKKKMKYLSSNSASFKIQRLDLETVSKVLATNKGRFMCGSEAGNQVGGLVIDMWRADENNHNVGGNQNNVNVNGRCDDVMMTTTTRIHKKKKFLRFIWMKISTAIMSRRTSGA